MAFFDDDEFAVQSDLDAIFRLAFAVGVIDQAAPEISDQALAVFGEDALEFMMGSDEIVEDGENLLDAPEEAPEPAPSSPIASSEEWGFIEFEGQMECDGGLVITIPSSGTSSVDIALLEDGRLLFSGVGDGLGEVLAELDEDAPVADTYVGTLVPEDGQEGINLVFTITFNDDGTATTHIGGEIISEAGKCSVDRPGQATLTD